MSFQEEFESGSDDWPGSKLRFCTCNLVKHIEVHLQTTFDFSLLHKASHRISVRNTETVKMRDANTGIEVRIKRCDDNFISDESRAPSETSCSSTISNDCSIIVDSGARF